VTALLAYVRPHRRALVLAGILGLLGSAAGLAQPLAAREVIEALGADESLAGPILILSGLVVVSALVIAAHLWLLERTAQRIVLGARRGLAGRVLRLRMPELDRLAPGDLVARATSDTTLLGEVTSTGLVQLFNGAITLLGAVVLMAVIDVPLLLVTLAVLVTIGGAVGFVMPAIARATERAQASVGDMGSVLERALGAIRTVKASGAEEREAAAIGAAADAAYGQGLRSARYQAVVGTSTGFVIQVAFLAVLGVGGARVATGSLPVGDLIAFLLYLFYLADPVAGIAQGATQLQAGVAAARRLEAVSELEVEQDDALTAAARDDGPLVAFDEVGFRYRTDGPPVLDSVSFTVPARGLMAIVGPSGAGKTTLFSLLERFYEPGAGAISFAGRDLRAWPRAELRAAIAYVEQEAPVLSGSLRDNLLYAAPEATDGVVRAALAATRLEGLVARLPDGLETEVGARGLALSGGERQRIAIARALLRRPRLLLLDEASSQLDAVNEQALRAAVAAAAAEHAVVAIAHRLSTVVAADRIIVLDGGRVRAQGTHGELVEGDELYRELAATQLTA
jgi:ABC-type multidrug transport system fused ATPase/permease subunit